jgi:hypothetical protein
MIQLDDTHGKIINNSGFYRGELLTKLNGFFSEHFNE